MNLEKRSLEMQDFFNEKADGYDEVHLPFMDSKKMICDSLDNSVERILDLGAGTGLELVPIFEKYPNVHVTAIDITEKMLNLLKERDFGDKVDIICGDFFKVDFGDNYDAVISSAALHHFVGNDKLNLYKKVYDSLKKGGLFLNCDCHAIDDEDEEKRLREFIETPDLMRHMDTPVTVKHEIEFLINAGFSEAYVKGDTGKYQLVIGKK